MGGGEITESGAELLFGVLKFPHLQSIIQSTKPKFLRHF
jgi:hypothetical protein